MTSAKADGNHQKLQKPGIRILLLFLISFGLGERGTGVVSLPIPGMLYCHILAAPDPSCNEAYPAWPGSPEGQKRKSMMVSIPHARSLLAGGRESVKCTSTRSMRSERCSDEART